MQATGTGAAGLVAAEGQMKPPLPGKLWSTRWLLAQIGSHLCRIQHLRPNVLGIGWSTWSTVGGLNGRAIKQFEDLKMGSMPIVR